MMAKPNAVRPIQTLVANGGILPGYAFDDGAAGHFVDGKLNSCISSRPNAKGYYVKAHESQAVETTLDTRYLG